MQIPKEILSEKNYTGTRLIEVNDPKVKELKEKLKKIQVEEVNPILDATQPLLDILDPFYTKIRELRESIKPILAEAKPLMEEYQALISKTEIKEPADSPKLKELKEKIAELQAQYNEEYDKLAPAIPELDLVGDKMKRYINKIRGIEYQIDEVKEEMKPTREKYEEEMKKIEVIDQRAVLIKQKLVPLVNKAIEAELGEFEKALQVIEKDDKIFVEVVDEIEEKVKKIREERMAVTK